LICQQNHGAPLLLSVVLVALLAANSPLYAQSIAQPPPLQAKVRDAAKAYPAMPSEPYLERVQHLAKHEVTALSAAGRVDAQIQLARMAWWDGDRIGAIDLVERPAQQGIPVAQYLLGTYLRAGNRDVPRAMSLLQQAAAAGHPIAQETIAGFFAQGTQGFEKNEKRAFELYLSAGQQGLAHSQMTVGVMLCNGTGVERDKALGAGSVRISVCEAMG
jgi:TPR repeat protein